MLQAVIREAKQLFHFRKPVQSSVCGYLRSTASIMKIGTHDGVFHCDEVLACYMLKLLPEYKDAEIIRTRNEEALAQCDIVVDVGAVFNHEKKRYDHHQRDFTGTLSELKPEVGSEYTIKLSSAGLVYTYYGDQVLPAVEPKVATLPPKDQMLIYRKVYENLIEEIDAIDNGVPIAEGTIRYTIRSHLSARVGRLNPEWNSDGKINIYEQFEKAMAMVGDEFCHIVNYLMNVWLPARVYVKTALENRFNVHESGQIIEFVDRVPWKQHLFELEKDMDIKNINEQIKYAIFKDKPESWRVQAVPIDPTSFIARQSINKKWWGLRDEKLNAVSGIEGCIFCHGNGFIAGTTTREAALKMAIECLAACDDDFIDLTSEKK